MQDSHGKHIVATNPLLSNANQGENLYQVTFFAFVKNIYSCVIAKYQVPGTQKLWASHNFLEKKR